MHIHTITTANRTLLTSIRQTLTESSVALLCVAFASDAGVNLLNRELKALGGNARLLVTTTFGSTTASALNQATGYGNHVSVLNPGSGTYHPKLYLGRHGQQAAAVIGSANLTRGLVGNVELATHMVGNSNTEALDDAWRWAEELWRDERVTPWTPNEVQLDDGEAFADDLWALLQHEVARDPVFMTLGSRPRPNRVIEITPGGLWVETERTADRGTGAQLIPSWMFNLAWVHLQRHGSLSNRHLLDELRVHRSSAVCAVLGRLEPVDVVEGRRIELRWAVK